MSERTYGNLKEGFLASIRGAGLCGFTDGARVEEIPGGFLLVAGSTTVSVCSCRTSRIFEVNNFC